MPWRGLMSDSREGAKGAVNQDALTGRTTNGGALVVAP